MTMTVDDFLNRLGGVEDPTGNPTATNPDSGASGLYQIMPSNWPTWARAAGVDPNDHSAAAQRKVAAHVAQGYFTDLGSWDAVAVAWYAGESAARDWLKNPNDPRFDAPQGKYPSINTYVSRVTGAQPASSGGSTPVAAASADASQQPANDSQSVLPSDARVVMIDGKWPVVLFDVGQGLFIKFSLTNPYQYKTSGNAEHMSAQQFNALGTIVDGGDAAELAGLGTEGKTFKDQFEFVINNAFGGDNNPALKDPQVRQLVAEVTANEDLLNAPDYIQNRLRQTTYYQGSSDQKLKWNTLSDAEKQAEIERYSTQLAGDWQQYVGNLPPDIKSSDIWKWAYEIAAGVRGEGSVLFENIMPLARKTDGSPLQRKEQQETHDEHQQGNDISTETVKLRDLYARWGVPVTDQTLQQKAQQVVEGSIAEADVVTTLQGVAKTMYPWKDPNIETADAAQPYLDTYTRVMEKPSKGVFDPAVQKALTNGTPLWQFEQDLKGTDDWQKTDNARQDYTQAVATAGKTMGFL